MGRGIAEEIAGVEIAGDALERRVEAGRSDYRFAAGLRGNRLQHRGIARRRLSICRGWLRCRIGRVEAVDRDVVPARRAHQPLDVRHAPVAFAADVPRAADESFADDDNRRASRPKLADRRGQRAQTRQDDLHACGLHRFRRSADVFFLELGQRGVIPFAAAEGFDRAPRRVPLPAELNIGDRIERLQHDEPVARTELLVDESQRRVAHPGRVRAGRHVELVEQQRDDPIAAGRFHRENPLRHAVFDERKIGGLKVRNGTSPLVGDDRIHLDDAGSRLGFERSGRRTGGLAGRGLLRANAGGNSCGDGHAQQRGSEPGAGACRGHGLSPASCAISRSFACTMRMLRGPMRSNWRCAEVSDCSRGSA